MYFKDDILGANRADPNLATPYGAVRPSLFVSFKYFGIIIKDHKTSSFSNNWCFYLNNVKMVVNFNRLQILLSSNITFYSC